MTPDDTDTIVAPATARGPSERGVVRLAGPESVRVVESLFNGSLTCSRATRFPDVPLRVEVGGAERRVPCDAFVWPDRRSYTRQPAVELHTVGSPPVIDALVRACVAAGARLAGPGEFTLRACLAGRLDLLQAEAVLAVIDARHGALLDTALAQLAGGVSQPLHALRGELLDLLADLEAGLDFVDEEDVRFVERDELCERLRASSARLGHIAEQMEGREVSTATPRVALTGPPNVGKSSLFNAIVQRHGGAAATRAALVADEPGVTRDEIAAEVVLDGLRVMLVDTPGESSGPIDRIDAAAQSASGSQRGTVDLELKCCRCKDVAGERLSDDHLGVATMSDLSPVKPPEGRILTSAATGEGIDVLAGAIAERLLAADGQTASAGVVATTAARCRDTLRTATDALRRAAAAAASDAGDELVAFELREALDAVGRVTGEVATEEVFDHVFVKFCIGK